tara:strand:- start:3824 stop:4180 length:357 start_codon:yes stop_codon:yes gene_type:complete
MKCSYTMSLCGEDGRGYVRVTWNGKAISFLTWSQLFDREGMYQVPPYIPYSDRIAHLLQTSGAVVYPASRLDFGLWCYRLGMFSHMPGFKDYWYTVIEPIFDREGWRMTPRYLDTLHA